MPGSRVPRSWWGPRSIGPRLLFVFFLSCAAIQAAGAVRDLSWDDIAAPLRLLLTTRGVHQGNLPARLAELRQRNRARVADGDRDHLIYYVLQSTAFTKLPPIEPAVSAEAFMSSAQVPAAVTARIAAFEAARRSGRGLGARMAIFRALVPREHIDLSKEYARAMTFSAPVGAQYQARGSAPTRRSTRITLSICRWRRFAVWSPAGRSAVC